jgi:hypothetical protein
MHAEAMMGAVLHHIDCKPHATPQLIPPTHLLPSAVAQLQQGSSNQGSAELIALVVHHAA